MSLQEKSLFFAILGFLEQRNGPHLKKIDLNWEDSLIGFIR
jgi:hypothetical protein